MKKLICLLIALCVTFLVISTSACAKIEGLLNVNKSQNSSSLSVSKSSITQEITLESTAIEFTTKRSQNLITIPAYSGSPYFVVNDNKPFFTTGDKTTKSYEKFDALDGLGRCGETSACVGKDIMPTEDRGEIGMVKPTGWQTVKYDCVSGKYLYNRCHLIGFQLTGENANVQNLITGTRYMNVDGMLPFENMVADYVKDTLNHVLYRVTPIFVGDNLVAHGVLMEAMSVEDDGEDLLFNVYCYNVQPQITIDYKTGNSRLLTSGEFSPTSTSSDSGNSSNSIATSSEPNSTSETAKTSDALVLTYVLNTNTKKFHLPSCSGAQTISSANRDTFTGTRDELISQNYSPCGICKP